METKSIEQNKAVARLITAQIIMGTIGILVKQVSYSPLMIASIRGFVGTVALILAMKVMKRPFKLKSLQRREKILLFVSGLALAANWVLCFSAYKYADVSLVSVMLYFYPVFIILASPFIFRERLTAINMFCVVICVLGMLLSSGIMQGEVPKANVYGIILSISAAVFAAITVVCVKCLNAMDSMNITAIQLMIMTVILGIYIGMTGGFTSCSFDIKSLGILIVLGVIHTGIAYSLQFSAIGILPSQTSAVLSYLDPVVAIGISIAVLGERMTIIQIIGALMILAAQWVWQRKKA